ncbi:conserved hypothetical protein [Vibrio coralliirubri]|uniref:hypothetical protein n=1 Tax=Vibrio coralliirubri TaxID=1516159 RepID=UPI0006310B1D|nr:hypothetical protein [Vibrio coralliirubri]CDU04681.1 conserved hypothetical protein [Vibrio coralliirubri]
MSTNETKSSQKNSQTTSQTKPKLTSVANSTSIAIQDATDNLRNINSIATTSIGVAMANFAETGDPKFLEVINQSKQLMEWGAKNFEDVGKKAAAVAKRFD